MTLDEAIEHAEEVADEKEKEGKLLCNSEAGSTGCLKCAEEHRQLVEWLKELKQLREQTRWTPVSVRLPKENETVIVSTEYCVYPEARYTKKYGWEGLCDASADYWENITGVTAWKSSLELYMPEKEDNNE